MIRAAVKHIALPPHHLATVPAAHRVSPGGERCPRLLAHTLSAVLGPQYFAQAGMVATITSVPTTGRPDATAKRRLASRNTPPPGQVGAANLKTPERVVRLDTPKRQQHLLARAWRPPATRASDPGERPKPHLRSSNLICFPRAAGSRTGAHFATRRARSGFLAVLERSVFFCVH